MWANDRIDDVLHKGHSSSGKNEGWECGQCRERGDWLGSYYNGKDLNKVITRDFLLEFRFLNRNLSKRVNYCSGIATAQNIANDNPKDP